MLNYFTLIVTGDGTTLNSDKKGPMLLKITLIKYAKRTSSQDIKNNSY